MLVGGLGSLLIQISINTEHTIHSPPPHPSQTYTLSTVVPHTHIHIHTSSPHRHTFQLGLVDPQEGKNPNTQASYMLERDGAVEMAPWVRVQISIHETLAVTSNILTAPGLQRAERKGWLGFVDRCPG